MSDQVDVSEVRTAIEDAQYSAEETKNALENADRELDSLDTAVEELSETVEEMEETIDDQKDTIAELKVQLAQIAAPEMISRLLKLEGIIKAMRVELEDSAQEPKECLNTQIFKENGNDEG